MASIWRIEGVELANTEWSEVGSTHSAVGVAISAVAILQKLSIESSADLGVDLAYMCPRRQS